MWKARDNPYRAECIDALRFRMPGFSWPEFLEKLQRAKFRGSIVGPHGHGKTTLVAELIARLQSAGEGIRHLQLNSDDRRDAAAIVCDWCRASQPQEILVLDGAEQLNWLAWRQFESASRSQRGLLITQHRHQRLPTLLECHSSFPLFEQLVEELAGRAAPSRQELKVIYQQFRGNIRECFWKLYDSNDTLLSKGEAQPGAHDCPTASSGL